MSKEALPKSIINLRNIMLPIALVLFTIDVFDVVMYNDQSSTNPRFGPAYTNLMPGMAMNWIVICFIGNLSLFFGALWLETKLLMISILCYFVCLPSYTPCMIYFSYATGEVFRVWWYAALAMVQLLVGVSSLYLYAWVQAEINERER